jgi:hypothetical protein
MLESFKRWIHRGAPSADWSAVEAWALQRGFAYKREREGEGFVVNAKTDGVAWRLEWGPSQRSYVVGQELRIRAPLAMSADLHMLVLPRALMERLERETFERYTESLQTMIDRDTPEEMRWLVLFPKPSAGEFKALRSSGFEPIGSVLQPLRTWVDGGIGSALERAAGQWLSPKDPLVLMTLRSRLVLRMALAGPDVPRLDAAVVLFEDALRSTVGVVASAPDLAGAQVSTAPGAWQSGFQPTDNPAPDPDKDTRR